MCYLLVCLVQVMVWWLLLLPLGVAALCRPGHQFWDETSERCVNCSKCPVAGHVVLRPCQVHQDTQCGPLSALDIDWSFLNRPRSSKATSVSRHQHLSAKHHEVFAEEHFSDSAVAEDVRSSRNHPQGEGTSTHVVKHKEKNSHPKFVSSEGIKARNHKKSHHIKLSTEESYSEHRDESPRHHKHHHYHEEHASSERRCSNPRKLRNHNQNRTKSQQHSRQKCKWTSSETVHSFDSEPRRVDGRRWSFSESASSAERHASSSRKSNDTMKHHHHHHKHTDEHREKKLEGVQDEAGGMPVRRPESASQLRESEEAVVNSSLDGGLLPRRISQSVVSAPFSSAEELVWDWQAVAMALAVFACLLFFAVACVYSVHHARQWRRLKDHFEDFEAGQSRNLRKGSAAERGRSRDKGRGVKTTQVETKEFYRSGGKNVALHV